MGLETGTYISQLNAANPVGTDLKSQGDDHIRLVKAVLQATFPNASKAFRFPSSLAAQTTTYAVGASSSDNVLVPCDASSGAFEVTLPASPGYDGYTVVVVKTDVTSNQITINGNGNLINASASYILGSIYQTVVLKWCSTLGLWLAMGSADQAIPTGAISAYGATSAPPGWLRANGRTIGNASSGATERANADTVALYTFLWNNYGNAVCAVSSGRGASAAADYAANKTIALPDLRGRTLFGLDDMGNSAASRLGSVITEQTTNGSSGGAETVTIARADLPDDTVSVTVSITDPGHTHPYVRQTGQSDSFASGTGVASSSTTTANTTSNTTGITASGSFELNGGVTQTALENMPPCFLTTWIIKL